jgi:hypothetical protein
VRSGDITLWSDGDIRLEKIWTEEIKFHLNSADMILLLISADFINSDYCYDIELRRALERQREGKVSVIPIILRHADWKTTPIGHLQALPRRSPSQISSLKIAPGGVYLLAYTVTID